MSVGRTKQKPVYVVSTPKYLVPLSQLIFTKGGVYLLFDSAQGRFWEANYRLASTHHKEHTRNNNSRVGGGLNHAWMPLIKYLGKRNLDPGIFFGFGLKKCDEAVISFITRISQMEIWIRTKSTYSISLSAISRLSPTDRSVPQVARHREMLRKPIGGHHAGVLPIIKEVTKVLLQRGLVRILFAIETSAMGANMPARTVVFNAIHKYDSQSFRLLEPGEYLHIAGRAVRRGLRGWYVFAVSSSGVLPTESNTKVVLTGTPTPLRFQFRLAYYVFLNLLRIDELRVEKLSHAASVRLLLVELLIPLRNCCRREARH